MTPKRGYWLVYPTYRPDGSLGRVVGRWIPARRMTDD